MTQRKSKVGGTSVGATERFAKPDAERTAQGAPPHEQAHGDEPPSENDVKSNDREHGYSQDSGYASSGGAAAPSAEPENAEQAPARVSQRGNGGGSSDGQIGSDVRQRLMAAPPPRGGRLLVSVGDGVVTLSGEVDDQIERERLLDLVRDVDSVRDVRDRLQVRSKAPGRPH
jgi:osmotically-inducible protein OsmY